MSAYVTGWKLPRDAARERLLELFPTRYERTVADHVTLQAGASEETPLPREVSAQIVGQADDGDGVQCLVVEVDGTTDRPDGSTYHITWSLGSGRKAKESNDVLRDRGWSHLDRPVPIDIEPAKFKW
jgi:hypothetical protein